MEKRKVLCQLAAFCLCLVHQEGMHLMIGHVVFHHPIIMHRGQGSKGIGHTTIVSRKGQLVLCFLQRVAVGIGEVKPSAIAVAGIVIVAVLQAFHHLRRDAQRTPAGEEMLQELAVVGDFECRFHRALFVFWSVVKRMRHIVRRRLRNRRRCIDGHPRSHKSRQRPR